MKIIFMGSPNFAVKALEMIANIKDVSISAVFSQPQKPKGRGMQLIDTPVAEYAKKHGFEIYTPKTLRTEEQINLIKSYNPDLIIVAAYGLILPKTILEIPKFGVMNIHASILPRWRGAAPIHHAIMAGDKYTGITIMQMDEGLDTGGMIAFSDQVPINNQTQFQDLHDRLALLGAHKMVEVINEIMTNKSSPKTIKQDDTLATYAHKIAKQDLLIDFNLTPELFLRKINALSELGAYFSLDGENIKILEAEEVKLDISSQPGTIISKDFTIAVSGGFIKPTLLQRPGKKPVNLKDFLNGIRSEFVGKVL